MRKLLLPENIVAHLHDVARKEGLTDIIIDSEPGSKHGENFLGELHSITLHGKRTLCGIKVDDKLNLMCKVPPANKQRSEQFMSDDVFAREAFIYNELLPTFVEFQKQRGLSAKDSFLSFPKCYLALADKENDDFIVIMEDVRTKGFTMWPKNRAARIDHCRMVIETLAKFHAVSFALKDQRPEIFYKFKKITDISRKVFLQETVIEVIKGIYDTVINFLDDKQQRQVMEDVKENMVPYFNDCVGEESNDRFSVITHGDIWNNNVMFKYNIRTNVVDKLCLLDWQLTRYASPVLDVLHYVFTATDKRLRDEQYSNLLQLYYATLAKNIDKLGSDPRVLFSYENFLQQLQRFGNYAIIMSPFMVQIALADPKDLNNLDEISDFASKGEKKMLFDNYNDEAMLKFKRRMAGVFGDIIELGYYKKTVQVVRHF